MRHCCFAPSILAPLSYQVCAVCRSASRPPGTPRAHACCKILISSCICTLSMPVSVCQSAAGSACVRVCVAGHQGAQQDDAFNTYRQRQGGYPRPPMQPPTAMPMPHQAAHSSQSGSAHGSDFGSGDRASLSGSEVASPTKSMQVLILNQNSRSSS